VAIHINQNLLNGFFLLLPNASLFLVVDEKKKLTIQALIEERTRTAKIRDKQKLIFFLFTIFLEKGI
jgi:hypothetical protein